MKTQHHRLTIEERLALDRGIRDNAIRLAYHSLEGHGFDVRRYQVYIARDQATLDEDSKLLYEEVTSKSLDDPAKKRFQEHIAARKNRQ